MRTKNLSLLVAIAVLLLGTGMTWADNTLAVTGAAAMEGSYGMAVTCDGVSTNVAYVEVQCPNGETTYRAQFHFNRNTLSMNLLASNAIFKAIQDTGDKKNIRVNVKVSKTDPNVYYLYGFIRDDSGGWHASRGMQFKAQDTVAMIEWQASSAPGANDGFFKMYKGTVLKATISGLDNDTKFVDTVRLGLTSAPDASASGIMYFDSFESYRTLAP